MALTKITTDIIADGAITSAKLGSGAVSASSLSSITTDNVSEGSTNLYFTDARADARIAAATTDDLTEGSNLYFTNERVDDRVNALLTAGTGITLTYDDANNTLTVAGAAQYGDSDVESYLSGGTGVTFSSGVISIGQDVGTSATPTFGNITTTGYIAGPSTFTIDPAAVGDNTGTVVIAGNLQVDGTTTTINSTTVNIDDLNIQLATGAINAAAANGAGITVDGASATITYDGTNDEWDLNKPLTVSFSGDKGITAASSDSHSSVYIDSAVSSSQYIRMTENGSNNYWIQADSAGKLNFRPAGSSSETTKVVFDSAGNVGIGTYSPSYNLDVIGTINASTNISAGNFITSSSDPTISSNPAGGAGSLWLNSSSGEAYICTDSTSGSNIWTNVGGGSGDILPDPDIAWLVIGGGGAGTGNYGGNMGGGGAGGMRSGTHTAVPVGTVLTATVGAGGTGVYSFGNSGQGGGDTTLTGSGLQSITSFGGGGGGGDGNDDVNGGSGGGQGRGDSAPGSGTAGQGNDGGANSTNSTGGGGGGAGAAGGNAVGSTYSPGDGGDGATSSITGSSTYYAGGGGGGGERNGSWNQSSGGLGGGGAGGVNTNSSAGNGTAGTANTGGGGGAASKAAGGANSGGSGGSGVVILRVETAKYSGTTTGSPTITTDGLYTVIKFTGSGTYTA